MMDPIPPVKEVKEKEECILFNIGLAPERTWKGNRPEPPGQVAEPFQDVQARKRGKKGDKAEKGNHDKNKKYDNPVELPVHVRPVRVPKKGVWKRGHLLGYFFALVWNWNIVWDLILTVTITLLVHILFSNSLIFFRFFSKIFSSEKRFLSEWVGEGLSKVIFFFSSRRAIP